MNKSILAVVFLLLTISSVTAQESLNVDRAVAKNIELSFPNEQNIRPKRSDFGIVNYVLMSNEQGERWSVVTLKNKALGSREFEQGDLMALFADGQRRSPETFKLDFKGGETLSLTVTFGVSKFPVLALYTNSGD